MKSWLLLLVVALPGCGPESRTRCLYEQSEIDPDELIDGKRAGDLLEPYFGTYEGVLTWESGAQTRLLVDIRYQEGDNYRASNVHECRARTVHYWSPSRVETEDGAFDNELSINVVYREPGPANYHLKYPAVSFSGVPEWAWQPAVVDQLSIAIDRYERRSLHFLVDWFQGEAGPTTGLLNFSGAVVDSPDLWDTITVGSLEF